MWTIAAIGFVGLGAKIAGRDWRYMYVAAALLLPILPYALVQPVVRYRYPIGAVRVFLAADMTWRAVKPFRGLNRMTALARIAALPEAVPEGALSALCASSLERR